jgi:hypothetical protein
MMAAKKGNTGDIATRWKRSSARVNRAVKAMQKSPTDDAVNELKEASSEGEKLAVELNEAVKRLRRES